MKVILNDYVENLGERGKVVTVARGFARNYLIPKGLAYLDTPGNRRRFEQEQKRWEVTETKRRSGAEAMAAAMHGVELKFERRAGERDALFGSVTGTDIAKELAAAGYEVDKRRVRLDEPIKELGNFQVEVQIHRDVAVIVPVHVVRPGEDVAAAMPAEKAATEDVVAEESAE
jgi:large subunit ribosomal protein L9